MTSQPYHIPPQDIAIEKVILGAMLLDEEALSHATTNLTKHDFYDIQHQQLFEIIRNLHLKQKTVDIITVASHLANISPEKPLYSDVELNELTYNVGSTANIDSYCNILSSKSLKRDLIRHCEYIKKEAFDTTTDAYDNLDYAEKVIFQLYGTRKTINAYPVKNTIKGTVAQIEHIMEQKKQSGITGVPCGLDIDSYTAGWQKSEFIIIAARPSVGKTALSLAIATHACLNANTEDLTTVVFFSLEMSSHSLIRRMLAMKSKINSFKINSGRLTPDDFSKIQEAAGFLSHAKMFIDDTPALSVMQMRATCRRLKKDNNLGLVIVDYLQLMRSEKNNMKSKEQEISAISQGLKALAKELDVPIIALSQLSRQSEMRQDKRPILSDLRDSGAIEQDADVVIFLYAEKEEDIHTGSSRPSSTVEAIISKQRNGPTGTVKLHFKREYILFQNSSEQSNESQSFAPF